MNRDRLDVNGLSFALPYDHTLVDRNLGTIAF